MAEVRTTNEAGKEEAELKRTNPEDDTSTAEEDDDDDSDMDPSANNVLDRVDKTGENGTNKSDKQTDLMPSDKTVDEGEKDGARLEHSQLDNIPVLSGKENIHDINQQDSLSDEEYESEVDLKEKVELDPVIIAQNELIETATPSTALEVALDAALKRKEIHIQRLTAEILKLKAFVSKRKQTYKRKRKDEGAPTRALSAYNIFIQDRFARLAKENEKALKSEDIDAQLKRVPPANLVAATGNEWKDLSPEVKALYEERAKADRKRYEEEMASYQPPDKQANRKRNKTGYNMFFSAHVLRLKQTDAGVPSERGSVARIVGNAWKQLSSEEKQYYEREADKHNGMHPVKDGDDDDDDDEVKRHQMEHYHMHAAHGEMHMHPMAPPMHAMQHPAHDPRHHGYYPHLYPQPPYGHYDYSQHHRHQQARASGYSQAYPPYERPM